MEDQALFSSKDKSKRIECRLLQFLFGASRANCTDYHLTTNFVLQEFQTLILVKLHFHSGNSNFVLQEFANMLFRNAKHCSLGILRFDF